MAGDPDAKFKVAVLGASGYTGAEAVRLLSRHPAIEVAALTADSKAGRPFGDVFPHLSGVLGALEDETLVKAGEVDFSGIDAALCCLPHGTTQEIIASLPTDVKVVDLSADFRLRDVDAYAQWYGAPHAAVELQKEAVYGLTELFREDVRTARLVANPGCYPTCSQLSLIPGLRAGQLLGEDIMIDAKSGVSGAGRGAKEAFLYTEVAEGLHAYGVASHRHAPEIEQGLSEALGGQEVIVSFTPHLMPMARGMETTTYAKLAPGATADAVRDELSRVYADEPFVTVLPAGQSPHSRHVRGSNNCRIGVFADRIPGRVILCSVIDNLVKGASGQAIQNLNLMLGLPERTCLEQVAMFP